MPQSPIFKPAGFLRLATIQKVDYNTRTAKINFDPSGLGSSDQSLKTRDRQTFTVQLPIPYLSSGGGFIGGNIAPGTPVIVGQAEGTSQYFILGFIAQHPASGGITTNKNTIIPTLNDGSIVIQSNTNTTIQLEDEDVFIGNITDKAIFDTHRSLYLNSFDNLYEIGQGGISINGIILRDKKPNKNFTSPSYRREDPSYNDTLKEIGMDPQAEVINSSYNNIARNPARIENREIILEYEDVANVQSNDLELKLYNPNNSSNISNTNIVERRKSRADTLSLSLVSPNYLMESIKGTVVDIYGNILDLNRNIIPIGQDNLSVVKIKSTINEPNTTQNIYEEIKRAERRSLAYHFEINARKETQGSGPPNVNDNSDFARVRSRFYFEIDKEGQFKLNVPASSSTGNIPLLTRYENYSTVFPNSATNDPIDSIFNDQYQDILIETFAQQAIQLIDENGGQTGPLDRFSSNNRYIEHGTAYHNIQNTCSSFTTVAFYAPTEFENTTILGSGGGVPIPNIVSPQIIIAGSNANAGGRSGSINFDGSVDLNIGANEIDNQSLWLDTQGGIVGNVGADNNGLSIAASLDGNILLELGTADLTNTTSKAGPKVFDLRVSDGVGNFTIFRLDQTGLSVSTQGRCVFYSSSDMMLRSAGTIHIDGEAVVIQNRQVDKDVGRGSI